MDRIKNIIIPLKKRKYAMITIVSIFLLGIGYLLSAASLGILSTPQLSGTLLEKLEFGISKSFSTFTLLDYLFIVLFPVLGGLLIAHFVYQKDLSKSKTKKGKVGIVGIVGGVSATACAGCLLPVFGLVAIAGILSPILSLAKVAALALLVYGLYSASKQTCIACKIK